MADLTTDDQSHAPSIDDLVSAVGDLSAPDTYVPPRSGTFRTSQYPAFFSSATGAAPSINPNPLAGSDPLAQPPTGVDPNAPAPAAPTTLGSITSNPGTDPGDSATERAANAEETGRQVGYDTDPGDLAKALNLASSFTGPTGIIGLGISEGANALGFDPTGMGSSFDLKNNANLKPGWADAYDAGLTDAHARGLTGLPAANLAGQTANATLDYNGEGRPNITSTVPSTPKPTPVTQANSVTGFQQPAGPSDKTVSPGAGPTTSGATTTTAGVSPGPAGAPIGALIGAQAGNGNGKGGSPNGGGGGFGHDDAGNSNAGRRGFSKGGVVSKMKPEHKKAALHNHHILSKVAEKKGMTVPALVARAKGAKGELGARARLEDRVSGMAYAQHKSAGGTVTDGHWMEKAFGNAHGQLHKELGVPGSKTIPVAKLNTATSKGGLEARRAQAVLNARGSNHMADGGVLSRDPEPDDSSQYNPPPAATQGNSDTEPAMLTPGEMVITKQAATQYDPDVLAAMNDPTKAAQINQIVEQYLSGAQGDDSGDDEGDDTGDTGDSSDASDTSDDGTSDDNSGLGVMQDTPTISAALSGVRQPKSRLAQITRAA